jgi:hypothetical protein
MSENIEQAVRSKYGSIANSDLSSEQDGVRASKAPGRVFPKLRLRPLGRNSFSKRATVAGLIFSNTFPNRFWQTEVTVSLEYYEQFRQERDKRFEQS